MLEHGVAPAWGTGQNALLDYELREEAAEGEMRELWRK
jgi:hypothetical protein